MKDEPMMTTFFPLAAAAMALASSGVRRENTFFKSTPGIGSTRGLGRHSKHVYIVVVYYRCKVKFRSFQKT